jgi:hypothetical protein
VSPGLAPRLWPSPNQELLLRAVFAQEDEARSAWDGLRASFDLDRLEEGSYALMPLLGRRLAEWGLDVELETRLRGVYRHAWYRGHVLLERVTELVAAARGDRVDILVTGEPRLLLRSYGDPGLRPATRIDFLVLRADQARLARTIEQAGWSPTRSNARTAWFERTDAPAVSLQHGLAEAWPHAVAVELGNGAQQPATSPTDELLRICTGEERRFPWHRLQWIADADAILRAEGNQVDWDRLPTAAAAEHASLNLRDALRYLEGRITVPIPEPPLARLDRIRPGARERIAHLAGR